MSDSSVTLLALAVCAMIVIAISGDAQAPVADPRPQYVTAEIIVKFHVDTESSTRYNIRSEFADHTLRTFKSGAEHWNLRSTYSVEDAVDRLSRDPAIKYAHPNWYVVPAATIPNDTRFSEQWSLYNTGQSVGGSSGTVDKDIDSELAWDISTGSASVVIAIIEDSGADLGHSDLAPNIWSNAGEVGGFQGVDDDGNGHVDDLKGWDWAEGDGEPVPWSTSLAGCTQIGPLSALRHGTAVAGIIGAVGNNEKGVSGVNWAVRMMILKHTGNIATATAAVEYAIENRANIINASWRVTCTAPCEGVLEEAIEDAMEKEIPFIVAADNNSMDIDVNPIYPASYDISNVIPVAATDANDALAPFSNYGGSTVDLSAPGTALWTTVPRFSKIGWGCFPPTSGIENSDPNQYALYAGTSFSAPLVAGVAGLLKSLVIGMPVSVLKSRLLDNTDHVPAHEGYTVTAGRANAVSAMEGHDSSPPSAITSLTGTASTTSSVSLQWTATGDDGSAGAASSYQMRYSSASFNDPNFYYAVRAGGEPSPEPVGSSQGMTVGGLASGTCYYFAIKAFDEWGNGPSSNVRRCGTRPAACTVSYCKQGPGEVFQRCTFTGSFGNCGCCQYNCVVDETCLEPDPTPTYACNWCV